MIHTLMPVPCQWSLPAAFNWIVRTGNYLGTMACSGVGQEDSPIVAIALWMHHRIFG